MTLSKRMWFSVWMLLSISAKSQDVFSSHFIAVESNKGVLLSWIINQGNTCNGIDIYRGVDTLHYEHIGNIPGICGSGTEPQTFEFRDLNPIRNKTIFYKVKFGKSGYENTTTILLLDLTDEGVQIRPNPTTGVTRIYFSNANNRPYRLLLTNSSGKESIMAESADGFFDIDLVGVETGIYYYTISEVGRQEHVTRGKISVVR